MSTFEVIRGAEGHCLVLDGTRIAGPKPWGGGRIVHEWRTEETYADAATVGAGTADKAAERIEVLAGFAREYLHRYGTLMSMMGEDVTDETMAMDQVINEVCGRRLAEGASSDGR